MSIQYSTPPKRHPGHLESLATLATLIRTGACGAALLASAMAAQAQVTVTEAWVRATVTQQTATGLFAKLSSPTAARVVAVATPVAGVAEIHEMRMDGDQMRMRALSDGLELPAGKTVELKPGGYHVMLMDLKRPLSAGDTVDLELTVQRSDGRTEKLSIKAPVRALGASPANAGHDGHGAHKH